MTSVFKTLRSHWKKSTLGAVVLMYGGYYFNNKHNDNLMRRAYCLEAKKYGDQCISPSQKPRRVTVLLNPSAGNGYAKDQFHKNAEPLLHLAGLDVTVVETQKECQARDIVEVLDDTDALIVAGGDGTVLEAVTGLVRSAKHDTLPVGIIPLGNHNTLAKKLYSYRSERDLVRWFGDACMSVIEGVTQPVDVVKIQGPAGKPVYSVGCVQWGPLRDAWVERTRYWYFGPLKARLTYALSVLKTWPNSVAAEVQYVEPCPSRSGCTRCRQDGVVLSGSPPPQGWLQRLVGQQKTSLPTDGGTIPRDATPEPLPDVPECGQLLHVTLTSHDIQMTLPSLHPTTDDIAAIKLSSCDHVTTRTGFIKEGWSRMCDGAESEERNHLVASCRHLKLIPSLPESESKTRWMSVDNENYEVVPLEVTLIPGVVRIFVRQT